MGEIDAMCTMYISVRLVDDVPNVELIHYYDGCLCTMYTDEHTTEEKVDLDSSPKAMRMCSIDSDGFCLPRHCTRFVFAINWYPKMKILSFIRSSWALAWHVSRRRRLGRRQSWLIQFNRQQYEEKCCINMPSNCCQLSFIQYPWPFDATSVFLILHLQRVQRVCTAQKPIHWQLHWRWNEKFHRLMWFFKIKRKNEKSRFESIDFSYFLLLHEISTSLSLSHTMNVYIVSGLYFSFSIRSNCFSLTLHFKHLWNVCVCIEWTSYACSLEVLTKRCRLSLSLPLVRYTFKLTQCVIECIYSNIYYYYYY